jgi:hypothetical protein
LHRLDDQVAERCQGEPDTDTEQRRGQEHVVRVAVGEVA